MTNTGDGPVAGPVSPISETATILYGPTPGDDVASLFLDAGRCAGGLAPDQSCALVLSSNVGAGSASGFFGETVSFTLAQANGPSFAVSVSLSPPGAPFSYWDGDNFVNFGVPFVSALSDRTSVHTLQLLHSDPSLAPRTLGTLSLEGLGGAFTVLTDGCSGQTLVPPNFMSAASCIITYVFNEAVAPGTPIFGVMRLPGSGTGDVLFDLLAP